MPTPNNAKHINHHPPTSNQAMYDAWLRVESEYFPLCKHRTWENWGTSGSSDSLGFERPTKNGWLIPLMLVWGWLPIFEGDNGQQPAIKKCFNLGWFMSWLFGGPVSSTELGEIDGPEPIHVEFHPEDQSLSVPAAPWTSAVRPLPRFQ